MRGAKRNPLRVGGGVDLRRELAEHNDNDRERGARCGHRVRVTASRREQGRDRGGEYARGSEDHQICTQPVIGFLQQPIEELGRARSRVRAGTDAVAIDRQHRHLSA